MINRRCRSDFYQTGNEGTVINIYFSLKIELAVTKLFTSLIVTKDVFKRFTISKFVVTPTAETYIYMGFLM